MAELSALVLGGSGEVGKQLLQELVRNGSFSRVTVITRRNLDLEGDKIEQKIVDFEKLEDYKEAFEGAQVAFCCLGTTRGKAGAQGFVRVDRDYVVAAAKLLRDTGCSQFHLVSSTGANKKSHFLYSKTKGEAEEQVEALGFPKLSIYRPALLLCDRQESRPFERVAQVLVKGFDWRNKISIGTDTVASAMIANALDAHTQLQGKITPDAHTLSEARECKGKVEILENKDILRLGID